MSGLESSLERRCRRAAKAEKGLMLKLLPWFARGLPDRLLILPYGWIAFLEFKAPRGSLEKLQKWWRDRLWDLGCRWYVVANWEEFEKVLRDWRRDCLK